jgi:hypothetical protein
MSLHHEDVAALLPTGNIAEAHADAGAGAQLPLHMLIER